MKIKRMQKNADCGCELLDIQIASEHMHLLVRGIV